MFHSYIAIGDSFTEGVGDWVGDDQPRGWADLTALGIAYQLEKASEGPLLYGNLAVRGRKLDSMVNEQLDNAIAQRPELISFNGGGNDILRPGFDVEQSTETFLEVIQKVAGAGIHLLLLTGPDPSNNLPLGRLFHERAVQFTQLTLQKAGSLEGVTLVDNFSDTTFADTTFWSEDGLHLSTAGHLKVATNCLNALGVPLSARWPDVNSPVPAPKTFHNPKYLARFVGPWIGRRLSGRSSGDGRTPKRPTLIPLEVED